MASAKSTTRKLTGRAKKDFFFAGLTPEEQDAATSSIQVRKDHWPVSKDLQRGRNEVAAPSIKAQPTPASKAVDPKPKEIPATKASSGLPPPKSPPAAPEVSFDPFVFGLVPVFKREGSEGLAARLKGIEDVENLRAMAKAQQIVLPREVRRGEVAIETVRMAILAAVEQRVTDRKAQL